MSVLTCTELRYKTPAEVRNVLVSFQDVLDRDNSVNVTLTGTPVLTVTPSGTLTATSPVVTTVARKVNTDSAKPQNVEAAKGVTFVAAAGTAGLTYSVKVACGTSGGETIERFVTIQVASS